MDESVATFDIVSEPGDGDCVVRVQGDIDVRALPRLRGALRFAIDGRPVRLLVDLSAVTSVDVSGLAVLIAARYHGRDLGTPLLLQAPNADTVRLLAETGLDRVLPVVDAVSGDGNMRLAAPTLRPRRGFPSR